MKLPSPPEPPPFPSDKYIANLDIESQRWLHGWWMLRYAATVVAWAKHNLNKPYHLAQLEQILLNWIKPETEAIFDEKPILFTKSSSPLASFHQLVTFRNNWLKGARTIANGESIFEVKEDRGITSTYHSVQSFLHNGEGSFRTPCAFQRAWSQIAIADEHRERIRSIAPYAVSELGRLATISESLREVVEEAKVLIRAIEDRVSRRSVDSRLADECAIILDSKLLSLPTVVVDAELIAWAPLFEVSEEVGRQSGIAAWGNTEIALTDKALRKVYSLREAGLKQIETVQRNLESGHFPASSGPVEHTQWIEKLAAEIRDEILRIPGVTKTAPGAKPRMQPHTNEDFSVQVCCFPNETATGLDRTEYRFAAQFRELATLCELRYDLPSYKATPKAIGEIILTQLAAKHDIPDAKARQKSIADVLSILWAETPLTFKEWVVCVVSARDAATALLTKSRESSAQSTSNWIEHYLESLQRRLDRCRIPDGRLLPEKLWALDMWLDSAKRLLDELQRAHRDRNVLGLLDELAKQEHPFNWGPFEENDVQKSNGLQWQVGYKVEPVFSNGAIGIVTPEMWARGVRVDEVILGDGNRFPIYSNEFKIHKGDTPTICPQAEPKIRAELLPILVESWRNKTGILKPDQTIHWVGRQRTQESLCLCNLEVSNGNIALDAKLEQPQTRERKLELQSGTEAATIPIYAPIVKHGSGLYGEVWEGKQTNLGDRKVALKVIKVDMAHIASARAHALALAALDHPNIVVVYALEPITFDLARGPEEAVVMQWIDGVTLGNKLSVGGLTLDEVITIGRSVLAGLEHMHSKEIFHSDLHAGNILIDNKGWVKIIDITATEGNSMTLNSTMSTTAKRITDVSYLAGHLRTMLNRCNVDCSALFAEIGALGSVQTLNDINAFLDKLQNFQGGGSSTAH